jgi:positive regulator of sigma E activity
MNENQYPGIISVTIQIKQGSLIQAALLSYIWDSYYEIIAI